VSVDGAVQAAVDVTNDGDRDGEEIVQLYAGCRASTVERPVKRLLAFAKIALRAGETKTVTLSVRVRDLARYDPDAKAWIVDRLPYEILVGPSSRASDLLTSTVEVVDAGPSRLALAHLPEPRDAPPAPRLAR
jgi:beta-glucosidase